MFIGWFRARALAHFVLWLKSPILDLQSLPQVEQVCLEFAWQFCTATGSLFCCFNSLLCLFALALSFLLSSEMRRPSFTVRFHKLLSDAIFFPLLCTDVAICHIFLYDILEALIGAATLAGSQ